MLDKIAFSPEEAAQRTSVGRTFIFAEIKNGNLPALKAGGRTLITDEALRNWLASLPARATATSKEAA
jgi:excisionase family DNA binding protein